MNALIGIIEPEGLALMQDSAGVLARPRNGESVRAEALRLLEERGGPVGNGRTTGDGVFDFRYGPFVGGYPEAGLFHLYTYGEKILSVEADFSYKHRNIEGSMVGRSIGKCASASETVAGNFAVAHSLAFCRAVEAALALPVPRRAERLRLVGLELERIYNHLLVTARLAQAAAQKVLESHVAALFEEALRINRVFSGSRLLAPLNRVGGVSFGLPGAEADRFAEVARRVAALRLNFESLYSTSLSNRNYLDRLHNIAVVNPALAARCSLTGPSLRAAGVAVDLRLSEDLLTGFAPITKEEGDALARMETRAEEVSQSCAIVVDQLGELRGEAAGNREDVFVDSPDVADGEGSGVGAAESPSGTVAWWVMARKGRVQRAYVSAPSVFGFQVFAEALCGHIFTDFPFAFDSFGLSFADAAR